MRCVSFRQLVDWPDVQNPLVLEKLRVLDVGKRPSGGGWKRDLAAESTVPRTPEHPTHTAKRERE